MPIRLLVTIVAGLSLCLFAPPADAQQPSRPVGRRVALVVGNGAYRSVQQLANPAADARLIARTLRDQGFEVIGADAAVDLDRAAFAKAIRSFGQALPGAEIALFYYAGHGMQVQGANWLVPLDAHPSRVDDLDTQMINAAGILRAMQAGGTKLNVVLLDACRNNPFPQLQPAGGETGLAQMPMTGATAGRSLAGGAGLAQMRAPEGTIIAFATQPGAVATDGKGANSPFALALVDAFRQPGLDVLAMFNRVGVSVKRVTGGVQQPWVSASPIDGEYYFGGAGTPAPIPSAAVPLVAPPPGSLAERAAARAAAANIPLPQTISVTPPAADVPADAARFPGVWGPGRWSPDWFGPNDFMLIVESVDSQGIATLVTMDNNGCGDPNCTYRERKIARRGAVIQNGVLSYTRVNGVRIELRIDANGVMTARTYSPFMTKSATLQRVN